MWPVFLQKSKSSKHIFNPEETTLAFALLYQTLDIPPVSVVTWGISDYKKLHLQYVQRRLIDANAVSFLSDSLSPGRTLLRAHVGMVDLRAAFFFFFFLKRNKWVDSPCSAARHLPPVGWPLVCNTNLGRCGHLMGSTYTHRLVAHCTVVERQLPSDSAVLTQTHGLNSFVIKREAVGLRSRSCHGSSSSRAWPRCWWRTWCPDRSRWAGVSPGSGRRWLDRGLGAPCGLSLLPAPAGSWSYPSWQVNGKEHEARTDPEADTDIRKWKMLLLRVNC